MRWAPFAILGYLVVLGQTTLADSVALSTRSIGVVGPDLMAICALFVALHVRGAVDAMLAAWVLGLAADLTTGGGPSGSTSGSHRRSLSHRLRSYRPGSASEPARRPGTAGRPAWGP